MMKKLFLATALLASMTAANAYQTEVNASYENIDLDESDVNTFGIAGTYYINPVNVGNTPLAEAAFLNKASNISLGYVNASLEEEENILGVNVKSKLDLDVLGLAGEFYVPNSQFYVSAAVNQTQTTTKASAAGFSASEDDDGTGYAVEVGYLPMTGLLLAVGATDMSESVNPLQVMKNGFVYGWGAAGVSGEDTAATLRAKYVTAVGNNNINLESQFLIGDETAYRLAGDLYLDPTLSIGASFADSTEDDSDSIFGVRAQKFITPVAAVGIGYSTTDGADSFGINGTFRF
ncbi:putative porin [Alkanindiges hydrocarboniclasticus]|jgi:hypothetical protein|uniref:Putative porin n=2 Tax=Alkanindiges hydrocarboniclasticus TaxID=1907941 RepID=A0A1S8CUW9_9GAMM|nr:putative porin [Alkanindiges hydrocarboniclasticus]